MAVTTWMIKGEVGEAGDDWKAGAGEDGDEGKVGEAGDDWKAAMMNIGCLEGAGEDGDEGKVGEAGDDWKASINIGRA